MINIQSVVTNVFIWVPVAVTCLSSIVTALSNYPKEAGVVSVIQKVISALSFVEHADVGGAKIPLFPAQPPAAPSNQN
jgi:hypothetical protein